MTVISPYPIVYLGAGNRRPVLIVRLVTLANESVSLVGATVTASVRAQNAASAVILDRPCSILDPLLARVSMEWLNQDMVLAPGMYRAEFTATWSDATTLTFPNTDDKLILMITRSVR